MDEAWKQQRSHRFVLLKALYILYCVSPIRSACPTNDKIVIEKADGDVDRMLKNYVDTILDVDHYSVMPGIGIERTQNTTGKLEPCRTARSFHTLEDYVRLKFDEYAATHVLSVDVPRTARFFTVKDTGKSSFLTGFGMGFLAFALKKLLLPVFIGAQLLKSVLIAMFLPSILGSLGKLLGKGLSTFSGISGASAGINNNANQVEDFEFKDTSPYNNDGAADFNGDGGVDAATLSLNVVSTTMTPSSNSRLGFANNRISYAATQNDNYYARKPNKKIDYKVFHKIPTSSLLLTSYDPFYSPLLSRLDAVFQQLGLGNDKSPETEKCRERLVCMLYANPAKYAPYSNLVSAQLSRELNELRKPTSDNPDILRFFRYMKAAKDGQDGEECLEHGGCPSLSADQPSPAILTTFNEINKLVQARKLK